MTTWYKKPRRKSYPMGNIPSKEVAAGMSTEQYIRHYCWGSGLRPTEYIIGGKIIVA